MQCLVVNTPVRLSHMAHVLKKSHSLTCTPRVHLLTKRTIPAFACPIEAGPYYRPQSDRRLSWPGWLVAYRPALGIEPVTQFEYYSL